MSVIRIERHEQGPRVHLLGRRVHEYEVGIVMLGVSLFKRPGWVTLTGLTGAWLVVKDWPDLFEETRDKACWRLGVHRLPQRQSLS